MNKNEVIRSDLEVDSTSLVVDARTFGQRLYDGMEWPWIPSISAAVCIAWVLIWPGAFFLALVVHTVIWLIVMDKPDTLPIHLPFGANRPDENNPRPGGGYGKSEGGIYFGRIISKGNQRNMEVWANFKSIMQHFLLFGTTGAGKTESIVSYLVGALSVGSGFIFNDAKAAPKAMLQMATIMRIFGRDDDFRVINYITGGSLDNEDPAYRLSNDLAAFARGSGETITQLLVSLMPESGGDNKIFAERAIALASSILPALTDLRDINHLQIDPQVIREHMAFNKVVELFNNDHIKPKSRQALLGYLQSLAGYSEDAEPHEQPEEVVRQFGFAQAYFTRTLSSLSDTYGHIYMVGQGEVDWQDAVLHGRCVMTLLPSLEKSGDELANLGKIVMTGIRNGMVVGLGTIFEGTADDIAYSLPSNTEVPYFVFNDETAYMLTESQDIMNAQARGLGFCIGTGAQDAPGLLENLSKTTKQIMANSAFKQIMYIDDKETVDLAVEWAGDATVLVRDTFERHGDMGDFVATGQVRVERRPRLNSSALKAQGTGECYLMYKGQLHKMQVFNHGLSEEKTPDPTKCWVQNWYSVRLAKTKVPSGSELKRLYDIDPRREYLIAMTLVDDDVQRRVASLDRLIRSRDVFERISGKQAQAQAESQLTGLAEAVLGDKSRLASITAIERLFVELISSEQFSFKAEVKTAAARVEMNDTALDYMTSEDEYYDEDDAGRDNEQGGSSGTGSLSQSISSTPAQGAGENASLLAGVIEGYGGESVASNDFDDGLDDEFDDLSIGAINSAASRLSSGEDADGVHVSEILESDSAVMRAVKENLRLMNWFADDEKEVDDVYDDLLQVEMFVLDEDAEDVGRTNANKSVQALLDSTEYPKAKPKPIGTENLSTLIANIAGQRD